MTEAVTTGDLLETARAALERYHDVHVDDDGALTFRHGEVPCALQGMQLAEGLAVLSLTCVVAWDLPDSPNLASSAATTMSPASIISMPMVKQIPCTAVTIGLRQRPLSAKASRPPPSVEPIGDSNLSRRQGRRFSGSARDVEQRGRRRRSQILRVGVCARIQR